MKWLGKTPPITYLKMNQIGEGAPFMHKYPINIYRMSLIKHTTYQKCEMSHKLFIFFTLYSQVASSRHFDVLNWRFKYMH